MVVTWVESLLVCECNENDQPCIDCKGTGYRYCDLCDQEQAAHRDERDNAVCDECHEEVA